MEWRRLCGVIEEKRRPRLDWCASLGCLDYEQLCRLKAAGVKRFHHNLETAPSFFPQICSTHSYDLRLETVREAKKAGLEVCCGGIFGLGESVEQRVEFALVLAREAIESIPLNFLIPGPRHKTREDGNSKTPRHPAHREHVSPDKSPGGGEGLRRARSPGRSSVDDISRGGKLHDDRTAPYGCRPEAWTGTSRCSPTSRSTMNSEEWIDEELAHLARKEPRTASFGLWRCRRKR